MQTILIFKLKTLRVVNYHYIIYCDILWFESNNNLLLYFFFIYSFILENEMKFKWRKIIKFNSTLQLRVAVYLLLSKYLWFLILKDLELYCEILFYVYFLQTSKIIISATFSHDKNQVVILRPLNLQLINSSKFKKN